MTRFVIHTLVSGVLSVTFGLAAIVPPVRASHSHAERAPVPDDRVDAAVRHGANAAVSCEERVFDRLFFGLGTSDGMVSGGAWSRFLTEVVAPRFPDGLTVIDAHGRWRAPGADDIVTERSRVVEIAHEDTPEMDRRIEEVIAIYKHRQRQRAVMRTRARVEVCL